MVYRGGRILSLGDGSSKLRVHWARLQARTHPVTCSLHVGRQLAHQHSIFSQIEFCTKKANVCSSSENMSHIILVWQKNDQLIVIAHPEKWLKNSVQLGHCASLLAPCQNWGANVEFEEQHLSLSTIIILMVIYHYLLDFITISYLLLISDICSSILTLDPKLKKTALLRG